ncbi:NAD(P)-binding domain-containing protein [Longispora sp. NPDC051575]|uniref:NAD(P)-binding domain-containing protein n=1 Tax=Longispora sp. NPDC051575 TaxID=3154943 RepID=UPI003442CA53
MFGFVGAGALTTAVVEGLSAGVAEPPPILLSPRGREVGRELAGRYPNVRVCSSNQDVVRDATTIVLAVRPQLAAEVMAELSFRPGQAVLSAMAGVRLEQLRDWGAPAGRVARVIPLPAAARRRSLTVLYPDVDAGRALFDRVGEVLVPGAERTLDAFSTATATFAAHLDYLATIVDWLTDQGVDPGAAAAYTTRIFGQLGESLTGHTGTLAELTAEYMTPGGINEQVMADLRGEGVPGSVRRALDRVMGRLRG